MEDAGGETNILLELLLDPSAPGALLKDHLLVYLILSKGIGGNQISSARERLRSVRPHHWVLFPSSSRAWLCCPAQINSLTTPDSPHDMASAH